MGPIILLSPVKKKLSCLNQERNMSRLSIVFKQAQNKYVGGFGCERTAIDGLYH